MGTGRDPNQHYILPDKEIPQLWLVQVDSFRH